ncbi:MAG: 3D domain-containing protein [Acidobacteriota bacterium]|nr:3D domain-containing protein [Acidobacteriota bacterium]
MKAIVGRSAIVAATLLFGLIVFSATPSIADTLISQFQSQETAKQVQQTVQGKIGPPAPLEVVPARPATNYVATAYSLRGKTASGRMVSRGLIAADPRVLPLGSRVRLDHPGYSGEYLVADTGGLIKGRRIDIWIPTSREAMRFGRRTVKLTVLSYPAKRTKRTKA